MYNILVTVGLNNGSDPIVQTPQLFLEGEDNVFKTYGITYLNLLWSRLCTTILSIFNIKNERTIVAFQNSEKSIFHQSKLHVYADNKNDDSKEAGAIHSSYWLLFLWRLGEQNTSGVSINVSSVMSIIEYFLFSFNKNFFLHVLHSRVNFLSRWIMILKCLQMYRVQIELMICKVLR